MVFTSAPLVRPALKCCNTFSDHMSTDFALEIESDAFAHVSIQQALRKAEGHHLMLSFDY